MLRSAGSGLLSPPAKGVGAGALVRIAWQHVARRQRLVMSWVERTLLAPRTSAALHGQRDAADRGMALGQAIDPSAFAACPCTRAGADATRIAYVGELSPRGGVADFLWSAMIWADRNPDRPIEITWIGDGDLKGVLQAQWTPSNLTQVFTGAVAAADLPAAFARCGLLVVPDAVRIRSPLIVAAMAAGLPVLGSVRSAQVRGLVEQDVTGWLFDPLVADQMVQSLDAALTTPAARLDEMRHAARAKAGSMLGERSTAPDPASWPMLAGRVPANDLADASVRA